MTILQLIGAAMLVKWGIQLSFKYLLDPIAWRKAGRENLVRIRNEMERQLERPLTSEELEFLEMDWNMRMIVMREKSKGRR